MAIHRTEIKITPSYVIGCGGMGTLAAYYCRQIALQELFAGDEMKLDDFRPVRYLGIDSDEQILRGLGIPHNIPTISFGNDREILTVLQDENYPQVGDGVKAVKSLFPPDRDYERVLNQRRSVREGYGTCPPFGRMGFLSDWTRVYNQLRQELKTSWGSPILSPYATEDVQDKSQVFILAGLYGGTGCGIHVDLAAMIRQIFRDLEFTTPPAIYGIFFLPELNESADDLMKANAYAALSELDYYCSGKPYQLTLANGEIITVKNYSTDWLFNKIFLINERNLENIELTENEAAKMVGTVVFHWCYTSIGGFINQRFQDRLTERTIGQAPQKGNHRGERRPTAYSTFGYATAHIPYDLLRHNLAVKFALRTMSELLLESEDQKDQAEMASRRESTYQRDFRIEEAIRELKLQDQELESAFSLQLPSFTRKDTLEIFMEDIGEESLEIAFRKMKEDVGRLIRPDEAGDEGIFTRISRYEQEFQERLRDYKDQLLNRFGLILTRRALRDIREKVREMIQHQSSELGGTENVVQILEGLLKRGQRFVEEFEGSLLTHLLPFAHKQKLREFDNTVFRRLRSNCKTLQSEQLKDLKQRLLSRCLEVIEKQIKDLQLEKQRFDRVLERLRKEQREYSEEKTYFCPIPSGVLNDYLDNLHFRPGHTPEDFARELREKGLKVPSQNRDERVIHVYEFDDYPEEICPQLIQEARRIIDEAGFTWNRSFSESGFFPLIQTGSYGTHEEWYLHSYQRTWEALVKRSAPYLEYDDGGGFDSFEEAYIIYPGGPEQNGTAGEESDEMRKWRKSTLKCNQPYSFEGTSPVSPYHISILQMHYGLPIYSIDEITEWREALQKGLDNPGRRPYYKTNLPLEDPYIEITSDVRLSRSDVEELYDWAKNVSDRGWYPIFKMLSGKSTSFLSSHEPIVRELYFDLYTDRYYPPEEIVVLAEQDVEFQQHLATLINNLPTLLREKKLKVPSNLRKALDAFAVQSDDPNFFHGGGGWKPLHTILTELTKLPDLPRESGFLSNGKALHVVPDVHITSNLHSFIRNHFSEMRSNPKPKSGITREQEIEMILTEPVFYRELIRNCVEALRTRPWLNNENLPRLLREKP